jgi:hypothetical protein
MGSHRRATAMTTKAINAEKATSRLSRADWDMSLGERVNGVVPSLWQQVLRLQASASGPPRVAERQEHGRAL